MPQASAIMMHRPRLPFFNAESVALTQALQCTCCTYTMVMQCLHEGFLNSEPQVFVMFAMHSVL